MEAALTFQRTDPHDPSVSCAPCVLIYTAAGAAGHKEGGGQERHLPSAPPLPAGESRGGEAASQLHRLAQVQAQEVQAYHGS